MHFESYFDNLTSALALDRQGGGGGQANSTGGQSGSCGGGGGVSSYGGVSNNNNAYPLNFNYLDWTPQSYTDGMGNQWNFETRIVNGEVQYRIDPNSTSGNWEDMIKAMTYTYSLTNVYDAQSTSFNQGKGTWEYYVGGFNNIDSVPQYGVAWGRGDQFSSNGYNGLSFYVGVSGSSIIENQKNGHKDWSSGVNISVGMKF